MTTERRRFIMKAGGAMAAVAAAAIVDAPNVIAQPKVQWRMSTAWIPALDHLQGVAQRLAKVVAPAPLFASIARLTRKGGSFWIGSMLPSFDDLSYRDRNQNGCAQRRDGPKRAQERSSHEIDESAGARAHDPCRDGVGTRLKPSTELGEAVLDSPARSVERLLDFFR